MYDASTKKITMYFDISKSKFAVLTPTYTDKPKISIFRLTLALKYTSEYLLQVRPPIPNSLDLVK